MLYLQNGKVPTSGGQILFLPQKTVQNKCCSRWSLTFPDEEGFCGHRGRTYDDIGCAGGAIGCPPDPIPCDCRGYLGVFYNVYFYPNGEVIILRTLAGGGDNLYTVWEGDMCHTLGSVACEATGETNLTLTCADWV